MRSEVARGFHAARQTAGPAQRDRARHAAPRDSRFRQISLPICESAVFTHHSRAFHRHANLHSAGALARAARGAYSSYMARADCPTLPGQRLESGRAERGRRAGAGWRRIARRCGRRTEDGVGRAVRLHHGRPDRARAREGARARPLSPLRFRKFRDGQRNRERHARADGCLESQPGASEAHRAAIRGGISPVRDSDDTAYC